MGLEGTLKVFSLTDIFQMLGLQRKTGVLIVEGEDDTVTISFLGGQVVAAESAVRRLDNRLGNLLLRDVVGLHRSQYTERDQIAVGRRVGDVSSAQKHRFRERPAHADQIRDTLRGHIGPRHPLSVGVCRRQQHLPRGVEMAVVPGGVFLDHRPRGAVRRDISGPALAHHPHPATIAQGLAVFGAGSHLISINRGARPV